jgi:CheY-like chemotaxis protein/tetratricopeptide (TPR) repeat protein
MDLAAETLKQLDNPTLSADERALIRCRAASELISAGQYERAARALDHLWRGVGERPDVDALGPPAAAEVLLQCGALSSAMGSARGLSGAQERAKDLLSEAQRLFQSLGLPLRAADAMSELAICYWRLGAFDDARVVLDEAARVVGDRDVELKAKVLIRRSLIETWASRCRVALDVLQEAQEFFEGLDDALKGRWHGQMALALHFIGIAEGLPDYLDRAVIEYTAAIYHYEQAGHERFCAVNLNNLAALLYRMGRYQEAHEHLDRAAGIFTRLNDPGNLAQVDETRAQVLLAEQRYSEAEKIIAGAIQVFERGGEQSCLADALAIRATVLARLGRHDRSLALFRRAISTAAEGGSPEKAGQASLSLIEEHGAERLSEVELYAAYCRADDFLKNTQDSEDIRRLRACARIAARRLLGPQIEDADFSLHEALRRYESRFIEMALERAGGSVSHAAHLLGFKHHGSLAGIIERRHPELLSKRSPVIRRRRGIVRDEGEEAPAPQISILHVEDEKIVSGTVRDTLSYEGYAVTVCATGTEGLRRMSSDEKYDLIILDNELPGVSGLELVRRARQMRHRRRTPIIMLSASDVERDAWRAGVDAFLEKPEGMRKLVATIKRLLNPAAE